MITAIAILSSFVWAATMYAALIFPIEYYSTPSTGAHSKWIACASILSGFTSFIILGNYPMLEGLILTSAFIGAIASAASLTWVVWRRNKRVQQAQDN